MKSKALLWICSSLVVFATPTFAQLGGLEDALQLPIEQAPALLDERSRRRSDDPRPPSAAPAPSVETLSPIVSEFCPFSFFSDGNDSIDFSGSTFDPCFDTGGGSDVFRLLPGDYPGGIRVFSGEGQSSFRFSNGPSFFFDSYSQASEVRAGIGNDTLRFGVPFRSPGARPELMSETRVYPGDGQDLIVIGSGLRPAKAPRHSPNLMIFPEGESLGIEAGCGRPLDPDTVDFIVENSNPWTRTDLRVRGCGVALRNHAAPTVLDQIGGRTSLVLRPTLMGDMPAVFSGKVQSGSGLSAILIDPSESVSLDWEGFNTATVQIEALSDMASGDVRIAGSGLVFMGAVMRAGTPKATLVSSTSVEVVVEGDKADGLELTLAAPEMMLEWRMDSIQPPKIAMIEGVETFIEVVDDPALVEDVVVGTVDDVVLQEGSVEGTVEGEQESESVVEGEGVAEESIEAPVDNAVEEGVEEGEEASGDASGRDSEGVTAAGRAALEEGRPVESTTTEAEQEVRVGPRGVVVPGQLTMRLRPRSDVCATVTVVLESQIREMACSEVGSVSAAGAQRIDIKTATGLTQSWDVSGLKLGMISVEPRSDIVLED